MHEFPSNANNNDRLKPNFIYLLYLSIATPNWLLIEFPNGITTTTTVTQQTKTIPMTMTNKQTRQPAQRSRVERNVRATVTAVAVLTGANTKFQI